MINEDICKLRDELNKKIEQGADYEEIYKISTDLDELIAKYYEEKKENDSKVPKQFGALLCFYYKSLKNKIKTMEKCCIFFKIRL